MIETRYFIYGHEAAFNDCCLDGFEWRDGALRTVGGRDSARLVTPMLDSGERGNVWQRVLADVRLDGDGKIIWRLYASDAENALDAIAAQGTKDAQETIGTKPTSFCVENAVDFLPIDLCGRYLRLSAEITGHVAIRSLMIFQSWESFLDYLPEIYRDYNSFFDRFLRLFAVQYLDLERRIGAFPGTLDPAVAPPETLRWLAELVGLRHINLWEDDGLRKLLTSGIYRRHGQFAVFADYVGYFTGYKPYIIEHFRYITGEPENDRMYTGADLTVLLPSEAANFSEAALRTVMDDFLPSDVVCRVAVLDPYPVVSGGAYLGVNTRVGRYEPMVVGTARVGVTVVGGEL